MDVALDEVALLWTGAQRQEKTPPVLASWTPNVLFGTAGLYLLFTLDT